MPISYVVYKSCILDATNRKLLVDLMLLDIGNFDVTLGIDWFAAYHANVDYY